MISCSVLLPLGIGSVSRCRRGLLVATIGMLAWAAEMVAESHHSEEW